VQYIKGVQAMKKYKINLKKHRLFYICVLFAVLCIALEWWVIDTLPEHSKPATAEYVQYTSLK